MWGLLASLLLGAAPLTFADHALAATCTFPLTLAVGATCNDLVVGAGTTGNIDNSGAITGASYGVNNSRTVTSLTNQSTGTITGGRGVYNTAAGTIGTLINNGMITETLAGGNGLESIGSFDQLLNHGTIAATGNGSKGVVVTTLNLLDNFGTISAQQDTAATNAGYTKSVINEATGKMVGLAGFWNNGTLDTLTNYGRVEGTTQAGIVEDDQNHAPNPIIRTLKNYGTIIGSADGIDNYYDLGDVFNYAGGVISGGDLGVYNGSMISSITNNGSIVATNTSTGWSGYSGYGIYNEPTGTIGTITNTGSITGALFGINNAGGTIGTLTNGQGGNATSAATTTLTYTGKLPANYFIYVTSTTHYGQVAFASSSGSMTFGVDAGSTLTGGTYTKVLTGITASFLTGSKTGTINGASWTLSLEASSTSNWDLVVVGSSAPPVVVPPVIVPPAGPSAANTLAALAANAATLRNVLSLRTTIIAGALDYDCPGFDANGSCLSFQARYSGMDTMNEGAGVMTAAFRLSPSLHLGGLIDYGATRQDPLGLKSSDQRPTIGAFLAYGDPLGLQGKLSTAMKSDHVTVKRSNVLANTEAGSGKASLTAYAVAGELGWAFSLGGTMVATPYGGLRVTESRRGAYSETLVAGSVDDPLSYTAIAQRLTTTSAGLRLRGMLQDRVGYQLGLGGEYDLAQSADAYAGTSAITGLGTFALADTSRSNRFRPTGSAGLSYQIDKTQLMTTNVSMRGQAYSSQQAVSVLAGYQVAF
jgi:hypothetical protein